MAQLGDWLEVARGNPRDKKKSGHTCGPLNAKQLATFQLLELISAIYKYSTAVVKKRSTPERKKLAPALASGGARLAVGGKNDRHLTQAL